MANNSETVLVTGATGFIGSHTVVELIEQGYNVIGLDNLANSSKLVLDRIRKITGEGISFYKLDIRDKDALDEIFKKNTIDCVVHFAGYKAVGESVENPLLYYSNNMMGTVSLLEAMRQNKVKKLVFSSSCTVYGEPEEVPITEDFPVRPKNPYGRTKAWIDQMLKDLHHSDHEWSMISLRYFNPIGSHESGIIGEDPLGIPNNLVPFITQTAIGRRDKLSIFGSDYPTKDGTCIRDYIHVVDLAVAHVRAVQRLEDLEFEYINLGTGSGYSILEVLDTFQKVTDISIPYEITDRRPGDAAEVYADPSRAKELLDWKAERSLSDMLKDAWKFQQQNPMGYQ